MKSDPTNHLTNKNVQAALAVVDAALAGAAPENKIALHPKLKKMIALEIAKNPSLTPNLFSSNSFLAFLNNVLTNGSV